MSYLSELAASRELLMNLTLRDIRGQYKRTILGQLWSLVNPLAAMLVYTIVFKFLLRAAPPAGDPSGLDIFPVWLLCGLLPWTFFSSAVMGGMGSIVGNAGLVQKVYFNRIVLPISTIGSVAFNWCFEMGVLVVVLIIVGGWHVIFFLPAVVVLMLILAVFASGLAMMLSIANVHFRDTQYFLGILFQIWMYMTPIVYPISIVQKLSDQHGGLLGTHITILNIFESNPMFQFVETFRQLMYDQRIPDWQDIVPCIVWAVVAFAIGLAVFRKNEKGLAEAL